MAATWARLVSLGREATRKVKKVNKQLDRRIKRDVKKTKYRGERETACEDFAENGGVRRGDAAFGHFDRAL